MPDILDVLPRIVLPDNSTITPDRLHSLNIKECYVYYYREDGGKSSYCWRNGVWTGKWNVKTPRFDRSSGRKDNNGQHIYENDFLDDRRVYWCIETPGFRVEIPECESNPELGLYLVNPYALKSAEVTGMVPYGEEVS